VGGSAFANMYNYSAYAPDISDEFKTVAACIIEILTLFGILNNPADKDNF
jgi:hypothetical protein